MSTKTILNAAALVLVSLGIFFKLEQWAGADIMMLVGFGLLLISTLALTAGDNTAAGMPAGLNYAIVAALAAGILGTVFKLMHWQGSNPMALVAVVLLVVASVLLLASKAAVSGSRQLLTVTFLFLALSLACLLFLQKRPAATEPIAATEQATE